MTDEEYDAMMDSLSLHAQNQVLKHFGKEPPEPNNGSLFVRMLYLVGLTLSMIFALPFGLVGVLLFISIIGAPLGAIVITIGTMPFVMMNISYQKYRLKHQ